MKKILLIITVFITCITYSQSKLNNYKYILVPTQFEFQRSPDIYQINSLTKFLFNKAGFTAFLTNESYSDDLAKNRCEALTTRIINSPNIFSTKVTMVLLDCNNNIVFTTRQGKSRLKDYSKAYNEAIREAFKDIENANYKYEPIAKTVNRIVEKSAKNEFVHKKIAKETSVKVAPKVVNVKTKAEKKEVVAGKVYQTELVGKYQLGDYGVCTIIKEKADFKILSGDENFEIAKVYRTSKPTIFIIKWVAFKQPQLLQLTKQGNLKIDTIKGVKEYKRTN